MSVTQRCEKCNTISNVTTFRTFDRVVEKVEKHKCQKETRKFGKNCFYCKKHITVIEYEVFDNNGLSRPEYKEGDHICLSDEDKALIDADYEPTGIYEAYDNFKEWAAEQWKYL